jgi:hypothetical protein
MLLKYEGNFKSLSQANIEGHFMWWTKPKSCEKSEERKFTNRHIFSSSVFYYYFSFYHLHWVAEGRLWQQRRRRAFGLCGRFYEPEDKSQIEITFN